MAASWKKFISKRYSSKDISSSGKESIWFDKIDLENMFEKIDILDYTYINTDFEYIRGIRNSRDFCLYAICILILIATYYIFVIIKYRQLLKNPRFG